MRRQYKDKPALRVSIKKESNELFFNFLHEATKATAKDTKLVTILARALHTDLFLSNDVETLKVEDEVTFYTVVRANFVGADGKTIPMSEYSDMIKKVFSLLGIKAKFLTVKPVHEKKGAKKA